MYSSIFRREAVGGGGMDAKLCDTALTGAQLAKHLKDALGPHAVLRAVHADRIAAGQGFLSHILRAKLTWETEDSLPKTVIVKVSSEHTVSNAMEEMALDEASKKDHKDIMAKGIQVFHSTECEVYRMFGKNPPILMPKCYAVYPGGVDSPPVIIMEDMT